MALMISNASAHGWHQTQHVENDFWSLRMSSAGCLCPTLYEAFSPLQSKLASFFGLFQRMDFQARREQSLEHFVSQLLVGYGTLVYSEESSCHTQRMSIFVNHNHINVKENTMSASNVSGLYVE